LLLSPFFLIERIRNGFPVVIAVALLSACVAVPVPTNPYVLNGKNVTTEDMEAIVLGRTTQDEVFEKLGVPFLWLPLQKVAVYGVERIDDFGLLVIGAVGQGASGGLFKGKHREAIFVHFNSDDSVAHWGTWDVDMNESWLGAALHWAKSIGVDLPTPKDNFVVEEPGEDESLVYFYRSRDRQYYFPGAAPAKKISFNAQKFVDVYEGASLKGQVRWQTYLIVRLPPGGHDFLVVPYSDAVEHSGTNRTETISLQLGSGTTYFIDIQVEAGKGYVAPVVLQRSPDDGIQDLSTFRETW